MIKTIQIAAVVLAVCAIAALVAAVFLGIRPDPAKDEILSQPGVVEEFRKTAAASTGPTRTSPLVAQAERLAKRMNPPAPPKPVGKDPEDPASAADSKVPPPPPPAKFEVVATAVNPADPSKSYALLSQPGKGFFWVKPGDEVSRAVIKQVLPGKIVTADGREYSVVRTQRVNLLKPGSPPPPGYENNNLPPSVGPQTSAPTGSAASPSPSAPAVERSAAVVEPSTPSPEEMKVTAEWLKAAMEDPESYGLTKEEAAQLGTLGQMLDGMKTGDEEPQAPEQDPNAVPAASGAEE